MPENPALRPETLLQHLGEDHHYAGAVTPPIFQTSLFVYDKIDDFAAAFDYHPDGPYIYSRGGNPTLTAAEKKIAMLEKAEACRLFASGMAAISAAILSCVKQGDHIVAVDTCYGPTRQFFVDYLPKFGVTTDFVVGEDPEDFVKASKNNTVLYYLESPSSLLFRLQDLTAVAKIAKERGISTIIDNSYASPYFQSPIEFGIDIVVHSATKYISGHSDAVSGCLCTSHERMKEICRNEYSLLGGALAPFPAWLILRSLRTLPIKMKAHQEAGTAVADWLETQDWIEEVIYVGSDSFKQSELRDRQMRGTGGQVTFVPKCQDEAKLYHFIEALEIFQLGVSWGGYESLSVPIKVHPMDWPEPRYVIRLFVGLEDPQDLMNDLLQAAEKTGVNQESVLTVG